MTYIESLKINQLRKLYSVFGLNPQISKRLVSVTQKDLLLILKQESMITDSQAKEYLENKTFGGIDDVLEMVKNSRTSAEVSSQLDTPIVKTETKTLKVEDANTVAQHNLAMKKKALETVIAEIISLDPKDNQLNKQCETFFVENQVFSVIKVVPFGVPCELPQCIVENIKEARFPVYREYSEAEQKMEKALGTYLLQPKYSVTVYNKDDIHTGKINIKRG